MGKQKSVARGALSLTASVLMVKIIGVIYKIPLSYILGDEGMGYFNSAYSVYGFFYIIATAGIPKAVAMLITETGESLGEYSARAVYKRLLRLFTIFGIGITAVYLALAKPMSVLIGNENAYMTMASIAPSIFFICHGGVSRGYLNGRERFVPIAVSQVLEAISKLAFGIAFAHLGVELSLPLPVIASFSVFGITIGSFFSSLYLYIAVLFNKTIENKRQNVPVPSLLIIKRVAKIAIPITLSSSVLSITNIIDLGVTMRALKHLGLSEAEASALYGNYTTLAVPMFNLVVSVLTPISVACLPRFLSAHLQRNKKAYNSLLSWGLSVTTVIAAPCAMILFLFPFDMLDILFTSQASALGAELLSVAAFSAFLVPLLTMINTALESLGKIRMSVISLICGAIVKVILSGVFISNPQIGILGAPISTLLSYVVSLLLSYVFLKSERDIAVDRFAVLHPILSASLTYIPFYLFVFSKGMPVNSNYSAVLSVMISTALYVLIELFILNRGLLLKNKSKYEQKTENAIIK